MNVVLIIIVVVVVVVVCFIQGNSPLVNFQSSLTNWVDFRINLILKGIYIETNAC